MKSKQEAICGRNYHAVARIVTAGFVSYGNRRSSASRRETVKISKKRKGGERLTTDVSGPSSALRVLGHPIFLDG